MILRQIRTSAVPVAVLAALGLMLSAVPAAFAQSSDSLDDLLNFPDGTIGDEGTANGSGGTQPGLPGGGASGADGAGGASGSSGAETDAPLDADQLARETASPLRFGLSASGGGLVGLREWDLSDGWDSLSADAVLQISPRLAVDLRPEPWLRFYLEVSTNIDTAEADFTTPSVDEAFIDYTIDGNAALRIGKQRLGWGQSISQLGAPNPGNLVDGVGDGVSVKLFLPLLGNGVTALVYADEPDPANFRYAVALETSGDFLSFGLAARYGWEQGLAAATYLKAAAEGIDLALELRGDFDLAAGYQRAQGILGFFTEIPDAGVQLLGQYSLDLNADLEATHLTAVGLRLTKLLSKGWTPLLRWRQSINDGSGEVILALEGPFLPSTRARIGVPVAWGPTGSYYRVNGEDPDNRVISVGLLVSLDLDMKL